MGVRARLARWTPFASRFAETAPACCNACRTCTTANLFALLSAAGAAIGAFFLRGRVTRPDS